MLLGESWGQRAIAHLTVGQPCPSINGHPEDWAELPPSYEGGQGGQVLLLLLFFRLSPPSPRRAARAQILAAHALLSTHLDLGEVYEALQPVRAGSVLQSYQLPLSCRLFFQKYGRHLCSLTSSRSCGKKMPCLVLCATVGWLMPSLPKISPFLIPSRA